MAVGCIDITATDILFAFAVFTTVISVIFVIVLYVKGKPKKLKIAAATFAVLGSILAPHSSYGFRCNDDIHAAGVSDFMGILAIAMIVVALA